MVVHFGKEKSADAFKSYAVYIQRGHACILFTCAVQIFMYYDYRGLTLVAAIAKQIINISQMTLQNRNKGSGPKYPTFQTVFNYLFALLSIVPFFQPHPVLRRVLLHPFRLCSILNKIASRLCDELELNQSPLFDYQTS